MIALWCALLILLPCALIAHYRYRSAQERSQMD